MVVGGIWQGRGMAEELPELIVEDAAAWREWLHEHHTQTTGVRLVLAKKGTTEPTSLSYDESLDEALCYGWIDGQIKRRDDTTYYQRFTPRRPRSPWSQRNVGIIARLEEQGRMQPSGRAGGRARQGRWPVGRRLRRQCRHPGAGGPCRRALRRPRAQAMFDILTRLNRYAILYQIQDAKRPETRVRRIEKYVAMLETGETPYSQKAPSRGLSSFQTRADVRCPCSAATCRQVSPATAAACATTKATPSPVSSTQPETANTALAANPDDVARDHVLGQRLRGTDRYPADEPGPHEQDAADREGQSHRKAERLVEQAGGC
jgi:uncharacterized protein YdeI (YjbR/CyaY-like superfamily)